MVFFSCTAADSKSTDNCISGLQRNTAAENNDFSTIQLVNAIKGSSGLCDLRKFHCRHLHCNCSIGFLHCHIEAYKECSIHHMDRNRISFRIADRNYRTLPSAHSWSMERP